MHLLQFILIHCCRPAGFQGGSQEETRWRWRLLRAHARRLPPPVPLYIWRACSPATCPRARTRRPQTSGRHARAHLGPPARCTPRAVISHLNTAAAAGSRPGHLCGPGGNGDRRTPAGRLSSWHAFKISLMGKYFKLSGNNITDPQIAMPKIRQVHPCHKFFMRLLARQALFRYWVTAGRDVKTPLVCNLV